MASGGELKANIALSKTKLVPGEKLSGTTSFEDSYGNIVSSVLVNQTTDYSIADDALIAYEKQSNGQIVEKVVKSDYTISHGGTAAAVTSVKPVLRIYNTKGEKVAEESSLDFYEHIHTELTLANGQYCTEPALAASPKGPIASAKETGHFQIGEDDVIKVPTVLTISDRTTVIKGKTTPKAIVTLKNGKKIVNTAKADKNGQYSMKIAKQKAGTKLTLSAKGMTYTKPVYKKGTYTLKIAKLPANTKWTVTVRDQAGNATKKSGVSVIDQKVALATGVPPHLYAFHRYTKTAPKAATVQKVTTKTTVVKGKAEKKATVTIYKGKKKMKSGKVSKKGTFSIKIPKQKEGTTLLLVVQDAAKNKSKTLK